MPTAIAKLTVSHVLPTMTDVSVWLLNVAGEYGFQSDKMYVSVTPNVMASAYTVTVTGPIVE